MRQLPFLVRGLLQLLLFHILVEVVIDRGEIPVLHSKTGKKARILKMLFDFYRKIMLSLVDPDISRQSGSSLSVAVDGKRFSIYPTSF